MQMSNETWRERYAIAFVTARTGCAPSMFWVRPPPNVLDAPSRDSRCARQDSIPSEHTRLVSLFVYAQAPIV